MARIEVRKIPLIPTGQGPRYAKTGTTEEETVGYTVLHTSRRRGYLVRTRPVLPSIGNPLRRTYRLVAKKLIPQYNIPNRVNIRSGIHTKVSRQIISTREKDTAISLAGSINDFRTKQLAIEPSTKGREGLYLKPVGSTTQHRKKGLKRIVHKPSVFLYRNYGFSRI